MFGGATVGGDEGGSKTYVGFPGGPSMLFWRGTKRNKSSDDRGHSESIVQILIALFRRGVRKSAVILGVNVHRVVAYLVRPYN